MLIGAWLITWVHRRWHVSSKLFQGVFLKSALRVEEESLAGPLKNCPCTHLQISCHTLQMRLPFSVCPGTWRRGDAWVRHWNSSNRLFFISVLNLQVLFMLSSCIVKKKVYSQLGAQCSQSQWSKNYWRKNRAQSEWFSLDSKNNDRALIFISSANRNELLIISSHQLYQTHL